MKVILMCVDIPVSKDANGDHNHKNFLAAAKRVAQPCEGIQALNQNTWLIPLDCGIPTAVQLAQTARDYNYSYRSVLIDGEVTYLTL
ncbi:MAG TPA: hypothetical protein VLB90_00845 [Pseudomonadales bacterium]|nr:hypothetical protein [Pseudomonadales bacterium]